MVAGVSDDPRAAVGAQGDASEGADAPGARPAPAPVEDVELDALLESVFVRWQHDFRRYARDSMRGRVSQLARRLHCPTLSHLQARVLREPQVFADLLAAISPSVSEMFRDPEHFRTLRDEVLPRLATWPFVKVWVAGCSRGEELWSLLVLFAEAGLLSRAMFYATDINPASLEAARTGVYPIDRVATFEANYAASGGRGRLSDHYVEAYGRVAFDRSLARNVAFADHSLATDSVFSEVHLVSCRNVLIYFDRMLQDRAIGLFADALVRGGFLALGARETLRFGAHAPSFAQLPGGARIWQRR
jgi:chemotaxis protein methyltransferase CheR